MKPGRKFDTEKPRWDLLPLDVLEPMIRVLGFGARKYGVENWKQLSDGRRRYYAALMRHLKAWQAGERADPESGESHLAHALCCLVFLSWSERQGK